MANGLSPDVVLDGGVTVISLGESYRTIGIKLINDLRAQLSAAAAAASPPLVVVNLPHTISFDSTFIEILVRMRTDLVDQGGKLALSALTPDVRDVFRVTQLDTIIPCFNGRDEAVQELSK